MVYLICNQNETVVKIGHSINPNKRLLSLQTSNHEKLKIYKIIEGDFSTEKFLHNKFSKYKMRGEFFQFSKEIKDYFDNIIDSDENYKCNKRRRDEFAYIYPIDEWIYNVNGSVDYRVVIWILKYVKSNELFVYLTKAEKDNIAECSDVKYQSICDSISRLVKKNVLLKKSRMCYGVNPLYAFKGDEYVRKEFIKTLNL